MRGYKRARSGMAMAHGTHDGGWSMPTWGGEKRREPEARQALWLVSRPIDHPRALGGSLRIFAVPRLCFLSLLVMRVALSLGLLVVVVGRFGGIFGGSKNLNRGHVERGT